MTDEVAKHLKELADGLKKVSDELMSIPKMSPFERQDLGVLVGLAARGIEMAIIADNNQP